MEEGRKYKKAYEPVSEESMERLVQVMLDTPTLLKLKNTEWEITALKAGTCWMIAKEAVSISKMEKASFGDVLKELTGEIPTVCRIITLALLNDKVRIEKDYEKVYDTLLWECEFKDWGQLLFEVFSLINIEGFFLTIELTQTFKQIALERKTKAKERKS